MKVLVHRHIINLITIRFKGQLESGAKEKALVLFKYRLFLIMQCHMTCMAINLKSQFPTNKYNYFHNQINKTK